MTAKDPYKDSPYDASGMPLATETVDYDKKEDVAKLTVKDKYVEPLPLFSDDDDFHEKEIERRKFNPALNNTAIEVPGHKVPKGHKDDVGTGIPELTDQPKEVDLDDPAKVEELAKEDPKQTNTTKLDGDKVEHEGQSDNPDEEVDLQKLLESTDNDGK